MCDRLIEREAYEERKGALLLEEKSIEESVQAPKGETMERIAQFLELAESAPRFYQKAFPEEKRRLLRSVTSNRIVSRKNVVITLKFPFQQVADWHQKSNCRAAGN